MTVWEFGLTPAPLEAVLSGKKTIEGRLNKGKFAQFRPGDTISIRADTFAADGAITDGQVGVATLEIVALRGYSTFADMVKAEGWERVSANAIGEEVTIAGYDQFYSLTDQKLYGVLAIEVAVI